MDPDLNPQVDMDVDLSPQLNFNHDVSLNVNMNRDLSSQPNMNLNQLPIIQASAKKYDVFLSFRGEDTRREFTSHLHEALKKKGIETFIDDEKLQRGDEISKALLDAIENSTISVIIFSENYASSSWCLDELVHILHCKENNEQNILPVFYKVDPSDVRKQGGSYADAFVKLEERFKDKIIDKWRAALTTVANLSGWDPSTTRNDPELIEKIVKDIKEKLYSTSSTLSEQKLHLKDLFGIEERIEDVKSLLSSSPIVGIWGMGGLGKTTLAKVVYKECLSHFKGHCFLANIREQMQKRGETELQKLLFGELLNNEEDPNLANLQFIKQRLHRKKVLIVLDDVDDSDQYDRLIGDWDWLNSESRVIITSRDRAVLRNITGDDSSEVIYDLDELEEKEALQLFCWHAFKGNSAVEISYKEMSINFVNYARGVPLALKVLGSHLFKKSKQVWDSAWNKLRVAPNDKIQGALEISFAGLDRVEREIFLDISCFFIGRNKNTVKEVLDESGYFEDVITTLVDKSLITLSDDDYLQMHDLIQEMGREITRGESSCHQEFRNSRLQFPDEICRALKNNTDTSRIKGIFLDDKITEEINLEPSVFKNMPSLRLLRICEYGCELCLPQGLHSFPDTLRYLDWDEFPLESLGSHSTLRNLVYLEMHKSQLERLWNEFQHDLQNLKYVCLSSSKKLTCLPDLSRANLKVLDLQDCTSLVELPPLRFQNVLPELTEKERNEIYSDVTQVNRFSDLFLDGITSRKVSQPSAIYFDTNVHKLNLGNCCKLKILSKMSGAINFICLHSTAIEELHSSIGSLSNLIFLDLSDCQDLENLPRSICDLGSLEYLDMNGCLSVDKFPELPKNIRGLDLSKTSIKHVPSSSFECLPCLEILYMKCCKRLESLPTSICKLKSLKILTLSKCSKLKIFPKILEPMENLEKLNLCGTGIKEMSSSIVNLVGLQSLNLSNCKNFEYVPTNIYDMCKLNKLNVNECPRLQNFPHYSLSSIAELHPSKTTIGELPFRISQMLRKPKCSNSCAGKNQFILLKLLHCVDMIWLRRYWYTFWMHFTCCECLVFYMVHHILMTQYFRRVVCKSTPFLSHRTQELSHPGFIFCYSGDKIPQWFTYQRLGPSININFSPLQDNTNVIGFAFCIVIDCDQCFLDPDDLEVGCECFLGKERDFSKKFHWTLQRQHDSNSENNILDWSLDLVLIWHLYYSGPSTGGLFEFYLKQSTAAFGKDRVKQCGIRVLYCKDAKQLDFIEHKKENINSPSQENKVLKFL